MRKLAFTFIILVLACQACQQRPTEETQVKPVRLITLDPGHFHAALIQKSMYEDIDSLVHVYAMDGPDLNLHLDRINAYNNRPEAPTRWNQVVSTGEDFFDKMLSEKAGNVVLLSGNNQRKTEYILGSLQAGLHVLADKPMVIDLKGFEQLKKAFEVAQQNNLLLYDIMTERSEITTMLQRELSMIPEIFGTLENGTPERPAITKESVHHFYKYVSGSILTRPPWFMDVEQQGEGIVDVMTHLVDLVQWECFPEVTIDYTKDIQITQARRWTTDMTLSQFSAITKLDQFPGYLNKDIVNDTILKVSCNGEINYRIKGVQAKTSVIWKYQAPEGTGDTHYSIMRGAKSNLIIRQGAEQNFKPELYIEAVNAGGSFEPQLVEKFKNLQQKYPGIELEKSGKEWKVSIPESYKEGHEAHFARVAERFIGYLKSGEMPSWEVPNMIAKYYTTTQALAEALKNDGVVQAGVKP